MKIDFTKKFTNFVGEVLTEATSKREMTLGEVCIEALLAVDKSETLDGMEKVRRYNLAQDIYSGKKDSLTSEDIVLLKELIGKYYTPIVVGQAFPLLDGDKQ